MHNTVSTVTIASRVSEKMDSLTPSADMMPACQLDAPITCMQSAWRWFLIATLFVGPGCSSSSNETRSNPSDDPLVTTINTGNFTTLLGFLFTVVNAELQDPMRDTIDTIYGDDINGVPEALDFLTETSSRYDPESASMRHEYDCRDGGSYAFTNPGYAVGGGSGKFEECQFNGEVLNGSYQRNHTLVKYVYSLGWDTTITYDDLSLYTQVDSVVHALDGSLDYFVGENENTERWTVTRLVMQTSDGETLLSDATTRLYAGDQPDNPDHTAGWMRKLSTRFTVLAPQTDYQLLTVSTEQEFITHERNGTYTRGVLQVRAEDGSEMRLTADNGDPATFQLDLGIDGSLISYTLPWEAELRLRCLAAPDDDEVHADICL